uniref:Uncharacterized protein n=1 Tax=Candidatus Nitrotoga fabula TaxID=2182327 RepID=A0A2X0QY71_9PROT|nr:exported protein of unknown function [Candidatus Nitrotoga fabula]
MINILNVLLLTIFLNPTAEAASPNMLEYSKEGVIPNEVEYRPKMVKSDKPDQRPEEKIFWQKNKNKLIYVGSTPGVYRICREAGLVSQDDILIYADKVLVSRLAATDGIRNCIDVGGKKIEIQRKNAVGVYNGETFQRL